MDHLRKIGFNFQMFLYNYHYILLILYIGITTSRSFTFSTCVLFIYFSNIVGKLCTSFECYLFILSICGSCYCGCFYSNDFNISTPSVVITICISSFHYTYVITSRKIRLKQTWRLTKTMAGMKPDTEQTIKLE